MQYNGFVFYYTYRNGPNFFLFVDGQPFSTTKHNFIFDAAGSFSVHCLAISIWHRSCCYGGVKCSRNHFFNKETSLRKRDMYLVINQVAADVSVGGFVIIRCWLLGSRCDFWGIKSFSIPLFVLISAFYFFFPIVSLLNLTAISLDRIHATFRPFKHRLVEKKIFGVIIVAVWTTAGLFTTSVVFTFLDRPLNFKESKDILLSYFSFFLFCLLIILVSYSSIAIKVVCGNQPHHHGAANRERKLTKTLFIVTVASLLRTLPYVIFKFIQSFLTVRTISIETWFNLSA